MAKRRASHTQAEIGPDGPEAWAKGAFDAEQVLAQYKDQAG